MVSSYIRRFNVTIFYIHLTQRSICVCVCVSEQLLFSYPLLTVLFYSWGNVFIARYELRENWG